MISPQFSMSSVTTSEDTSSVAVTTEDHIKVCVRIRPLVRSERDIGEILAWQWETNQITQIDRPSAVRNLIPNYQAFNAATLGIRPAYYFDHLFYPEHTNRDIFESVVKSVVNSCMNGFHGSVFTYGQTSSGKTFTMTGNNQQPGIIPQAINYCFDSINTFSDREFLVRVSYLEIYNEQVKDLLNSEVVAIKIQHDPKNGTVITGMKEQVVVNYEQTISLIKAGEAHRHVGATDMNEKSSRAHTLFKMTIESRERGVTSVPAGSSGYSPVRVSCLNLVDLAGSENAKMTNSKGERALEARYINQSLLTLSTIIHKLSEEKPGMTPQSRRQHLPYRDSKLTRILQPSLDGNAQIAVICTISPVLSCADETNNTLKFASRAKSVKMNAKVNDVMDEKTLLKVYREEIEQLKAKLFELEMQSKLYTQAGVLPPTARSAGSAALEDDDDDDEQEMLLQMITEMESMILKADKPRQAASETSSGLSTPSTTSVNANAIVKSNTVANSGSSIATGVKKKIESSPGSTTSAESPDKSNKFASPTPSPAPLTKATSIKSEIRPKSPARISSMKLPPSSAPVPAPVASTDRRNASDREMDTTKKHKSRFGFGFGFPQGSSGSGNGNTSSNSSTASSKSKPHELSQPITQDKQLTAVSDSKKKAVGFQRGNGGVTDLNSGDFDGYNSVEENEREYDVESKRSFMSRVQSFRGDDVGDKVLFGVSKMLAALKLHIGKSRSHSVSRKVSAEYHNDSSGNISQITDASVSSRIDRLELDLRLKEADNRFLQEELEKKDKMLAMLTEGLREVETSQQEWLTTNQELSEDLEKSLLNNAWLVQEIARLQGLCQEAGVDPALLQTQPPDRKSSLTSDISLSDEPYQLSEEY